MSKTITRADYAHLKGLLARARDHMGRLEAIHAEVVVLTGDPDADAGHSADAVYSTKPITADQLLKRLGVRLARKGAPRP